MRTLTRLLAGILCACFPAAVRADVDPKAKIDEHGFRCHRALSEYQSGPTEIKVLLPDKMEPGKRYPVIYVLPVEAKNGNQFGNGLVHV